MRPRQASAVVGAPLMLLLSCAGPVAERPGNDPTAAGLNQEAGFELADPPRRAQMRLVMIAMPSSATFNTVRHTLVKELTKDFDIFTYVVGRDTTLNALSNQMQVNQPSCVVLMDNRTVKLYREYQQKRKGQTPPAVVVMASFLEETVGELQNASGVAYEVPGVTAFVNLRSIVRRAVTRVGVLHRPAFRQFIERQKVLAAKEQITLVPVQVSADPKADEIRDALTSLQSDKKVDVLWVLNDNALLRDSEFLDNAWRRQIDAMNVPVVVGVPTLVTAAANFGTFAVLPDHEGLGVQAASIVFELSENKWQASGHAVELPIATITVLNVRQARDRFGIRDGALARIDRLVE